MRYAHVALALSLALGSFAACGKSPGSGFDGADGGPGSGSTTPDGSLAGSQDGSLSSSPPNDGGTTTVTLPDGAVIVAPSGPPFFFDGGWQIPTRATPLRW